MDPSIEDYVIRLYRQGNTQKQIAAITYVHPKFIRELINKLQFPNPWSNPNPPIPSHVTNQIFTMKAARLPPTDEQKLKHQAGTKKYTQAAIAKILKISPASVSNILNNKRYVDRHRRRAINNEQLRKLKRKIRLDRIVRRKNSQAVRPGRELKILTAEDFWSHIIPIEGNNCRCWDGPVTARGYGRVVWGDPELAPRTTTYAHRVAASLAGLLDPPNDPDSVIYQVCKNKLCCNPEHFKLAPPRNRITTRNTLSITDAEEVLRRISVNADGREEVKRDYKISDIMINAIIEDPLYIHKLARKFKRRKHKHAL